MISHKLSARVSRVCTQTVRRKAARERSTGREILIIPFTETSDVSHIFIPAEFDSSGEDYVGLSAGVSGDLNVILLTLRTKFHIVYFYLTFYLLITNVLNKTQISVGKGI